MRLQISFVVGLLIAGSLTAMEPKDPSGAPARQMGTEMGTAPAPATRRPKMVIASVIVSLDNGRQVKVNLILTQRSFPQDGG